MQQLFAIILPGVVTLTLVVGSGAFILIKGFYDILKSVKYCWVDFLRFDAASFIFEFSLGTDSRMPGLFVLPQLPIRL